MAKYLFVYHGGSMPETDEARDQVLAAWQGWFGDLGSDVVDGGAPVGLSSTVQSDGTIVDNGGSNPASGYSIIEASNQGDATDKATRCPILQAGGTVEVAVIVDMS